MQPCGGSSVVGGQAVLGTPLLIRHARYGGQECRGEMVRVLERSQLSPLVPLSSLSLLLLLLLLLSLLLLFFTPSLERRNNVLLNARTDRTGGSGSPGF